MVRLAPLIMLLGCLAVAMATPSSPPVGVNHALRERLWRHQDRGTDHAGRYGGHHQEPAPPGGVDVRGHGAELHLSPNIYN